MPSGTPDIIIDEPIFKGLADKPVQIRKSILNNLKGSLENLAEDLADSLRKNIKSQGKRGGNTPWIVVHNPTPLMDTWDFYDTLDGMMYEDGDNFVVSTGTNKPQGKILHEGGETKTNKYWQEPKTGRGKTNWKVMKGGRTRDIEIPARPWLYFIDEDQELIRDNIAVAIAAMADEEMLQEL